MHLLIILLNPKPILLILLRHLEEMVEPFLEFAGTFSGRVDEGDADALVVLGDPAAEDPAYGEHEGGGAKEGNPARSGGWPNKPPARCP